MAGGQFPYSDSMALARAVEPFLKRTLDNVVWQGAWSATKYYIQNDLVLYSSTLWIALRDGIYEDVPGASPTAWEQVLSAGGGGGAGAGLFVFQPGGAPAGNVYDDWADVMTAIAAVGGYVTVQIDTTFAAATIPAGAYDLSNVVLLGSLCGPRVSLAIAIGVTFTGRLPVFRGLDVANNATAAVFVATGIDVPLCLQDTRLASTVTAFMELSGGATATVHLEDGSELLNAGAAVIDLDASDAVIRLGDRSIVNIDTIDGNGTSAITLDVQSETATPYQVSAGFAGTWTILPGHYSRSVIYEAAHGFAVQDVVTRVGAGWVLADASDETKAGLAVVIDVLDADHVVIRTEGRVLDAAHGYTVGAVYYLSATTPGAVSATPEGFVQQVLRVISADEYIISFVGGTGSGSDEFAYFLMGSLGVG